MSTDALAELEDEEALGSAFRGGSARAFFADGMAGVPEADNPSNAEVPGAGKKSEVELPTPHEPCTPLTIRTTSAWGTTANSVFHKDILISLARVI